jgi:hypothetical protein
MMIKHQSYLTPSSNCFNYLVIVFHINFCFSNLKRPPHHATIGRQSRLGMHSILAKRFKTSSVWRVYRHQRLQISMFGVSSVHHPPERRKPPGKILRATTAAATCDRLLIVRMNHECNLTRERRQRPQTNGPLALYFKHE